MKTFRLVLFGIFLAAFSPRLAAQGSSDPALSRKPLKEQMTVLPFVWDFESFRFKPHDVEVPDELRTEISGQQLRIWGTKRTDSKAIKGKLTRSFGKVALFPASPQSGTVSAKIQSIETVTRYGIALDLTNGALKTELVKLEPNTDYVWQSFIKDSQFVLVLSAKGLPDFSVAADADLVKSFGFFATVRYPGNKADVLVTFDRGKTESEKLPATVVANTSKPEAPTAFHSVENYFVGRTWMPPGGSSFQFLKDGAGFRQYKESKAPFTWKVLDTGVVEISGEAPTENRTQSLYFRFVSATEGFFGSSKDALKQKLLVKP